MGSTPGGLPYPDLDDVPDLSYWLQQLAQEVEADLDAMRAAWVAYTPTLTGTGWAIGNGTLTGRYRRIGKTIHYAAKLVIGSTTTKGTGQAALGTPSTIGSITSMAPSMVHDVSPNAWFPGQGVQVAGASAASLFTSTGSPVNSTTPVTFATGDEIYLSGTYEEA